MPLQHGFVEPLESASRKRLQNDGLVRSLSTLSEERGTNRDTEFVSHDLDFVGEVGPHDAVDAAAKRIAD
jgi:hypothetical protein